ncbi:MAG: hypothetical protein ACE5HT_02250 [Gemmatimonadales bacterium]
MQCHDARAILGPDLGPRPDSGKTSSAFQHVRDCHDCTSFYAAQQAIANRVRQAGATILAPPTVRQRLMTGLAEVGAARDPLRQKRSAKWMLLPLGLVAAAAAVAVLSVGLPRQTSDFARPFVQQAMVGLSNDVSIASSDADELGEWLEARIGYYVHIPAISGAQLRGGRVASLGGRPSAAVVYSIDGNLLTYFAMAPGVSLNGELAEREIETASADDYQVAFWTELGAARAVVAPIPLLDVEAVAEECRRQASAESSS